MTVVIVRSLFTTWVLEVTPMSHCLNAQESAVEDKRRNGEKPWRHSSEPWQNEGKARERHNNCEKGGIALGPIMSFS